MTAHSIKLEVNGKEYRADVEPRTSLADFLRDELDLTGTHLGCEHGACGACTVLADGVPVRACINLALSCQGTAITTIEGMSDDAATELKDAFRRHHALQCGFCTPGFLATGLDLIRRGKAGDEATVRRELAGNLCRCTGYRGIVRAIMDAAERLNR